MAMNTYIMKSDAQIPSIIDLEETDAKKELSELLSNALFPCFRIMYSFILMLAFSEKLKDLNFNDKRLHDNKL